MDILKISKSGKYQYILDFSKKLLSDYGVTESLNFEIKQLNNKLILIQSFFIESLSCCFTSDGRARLTIPSDVIKDYHLKNGDKLKMSKRKGLIRLVYEVPKKIKSAEELKIKALKQKLRIEKEKLKQA